MKIHHASPLQKGGGAWGKFLALAPLFLLFGCSGGGELSKKEDAELRNNFTRSLTPEEIAKMGGAKHADAPAKGN